MNEEPNRLRITKVTPLSCFVFSVYNPVPVYLHLPRVLTGLTRYTRPVRLASARPARPDSVSHPSPYRDGPGFSSVDPGTVLVPLRATVVSTGSEGPTRTGTEVGSLSYSPPPSFPKTLCTVPCRPGSSSSSSPSPLRWRSLGLMEPRVWTRNETDRGVRKRIRRGVGPVRRERRGRWVSVEFGTKEVFRAVWSGPRR